MIVLIAGASGGLGRILAETLIKDGMTVYGTARNPEAYQDSLPCPLIAMQITEDESVNSAVQKVVDLEGRIDVVINCVNQMFIGSTEEQSVDQVVSLYNTNVFGSLRLFKAAAPIMRTQGSGTFVSMSSLGGLLAVPYMGAYTSAKFALEAASEAFYHEVKDDGIDVVIMQPVAMRMEREENGDHLYVVDGASSNSTSRQLLKGMERDTAKSKLTPHDVAKKISQVIQSKKRPLRVKMDKAIPLGIVKRLAPQWLINKLIDGLISDARKL